MQLQRMLATCSLLPGLVAACGTPATPAQAPATETANFISNGDFATGVRPWSATALAQGSERPLEIRVTNGTACVTVTGGTEVIVGWPVADAPDHLALAAGASYELSLRASVSAAPTPHCVAKVGHRRAPYTAVAVFDLPIPQELQRSTFRFTPDHADEEAGLAVECRAEPNSAPVELCLDDVALRSAAAR